MNKASTLSSCSSTSRTLSPFSASSCSAMGRRRRLTCPILPDRPALAAVALSAQHQALYVELPPHIQREPLDLMQENGTAVCDEQLTTCLAVESMTEQPEHCLGQGLLMGQSSLLSSHLRQR